MTVNLSLLGGAGWQFLDNNGSPLSGGLLYTYQAGTALAANTYTSASGVTPNSNPVVMNAAGRVQGEIWLTQGQAYKFVLKTSTGVTLGTYDNIPGANDINILAESSGSSLIGYQPLVGSATTVQAELRALDLADTTFALKGANTDITSLASPALGAATATTAAVDINTTQVATTAFVIAQAATATPLVSGAAAVGTSKKYAREDHVHPSSLISGTSVYAASGTSVDITGIPSWVYRVTITFKDVSTNGTSIPLVQLIAGSAVTSGYTSSGCVIASGVGTSTSTSGFLTAGGGNDTAAMTRSGQIVITYQGVLQYAASSVLACNAAETRIGGGSILLASILTGVRITTVNGTDAFDAGSISILYE